MATKLDLKLRIWRDDDIALGPGKADLLDAIGQAGSISGAARLMGLSYRRAWLLVDTMNRCFPRPLVATAVGGDKGGGAQVTDDGKAVLRHYRAMERKAMKAIARDLEALGALTR